MATARRDANPTSPPSPPPNEPRPPESGKPGFNFGPLSPNEILSAIIGCLALAGALLGALSRRWEVPVWAQGTIIALAGALGIFLGIWITRPSSGRHPSDR
jgi:hypothetical protein